MRRFHQEVALLKRRVKAHASKLNTGPWTGHEEMAPKGKFRKRKPGDCGRPQCRVCHFDKVMKRVSAKIKADLNDFKGQIIEAHPDYREIKISTT